MQRYEYKVIPAPRRGEKQRGVKTSEERFALAMSMVMNELGAEGWHYLRADTLPCDERAGLTGTKTVTQHMLVFCRALPEVANPVAQPRPVVAGAWGVEAAPAAKMRNAFPEGHAADGSADENRQVRLGAATAPSGATPSLGPATETGN